MFAKGLKTLVAKCKKQQKKIMMKAKKQQRIKRLTHNNFFFLKSRHTQTDQTQTEKKRYLNVFLNTFAVCLHFKFATTKQSDFIVARSLAFFFVSIRLWGLLRNS